VCNGKSEMECKEEIIASQFFCVTRKQQKGILVNVNSFSSLFNCSKLSELNEMPEYNMFD
jgi:hypothetical protein